MSEEGGKRKLILFKEKNKASSLYKRNREPATATRCHNATMPECHPRKLFSSKREKTASLLWKKKKKASSLYQKKRKALLLSFFSLITEGSLFSERKRKVLFFTRAKESQPQCQSATVPQCKGGDPGKREPVLKS